jgi:hypothetical protein
MAAPVHASLALQLSLTSAPAGTKVEGHTLGQGDVALAAGQALPLLVVPGDVADQVTAAGDERLTTLGTLVIDGLGNGTTEFTVPDLPPGPYVVMIICTPCAPSSAGRDLLPVADFTIAQAGDNGASPARILTVALAFMTITFVAGAALYWAVTKVRRPPDDPEDG